MEILSIPFAAILIVLVVVFLGFPLFYRRPILLSERSAIALITISLGFIGAQLQSWYFPVIAISALSLLIVRTWIIIGIPRDKIREALASTLLGIRVSFEEADRGRFILQDLGKIYIVSLGRWHATFFRLRSTKKTRLLKHVFQKIVTN